MNDHPAPPPPITITIGGTAYRATCPPPHVWQEYQKHAALTAPLLDQLKATGTLLHAIIGPEARNEIAARFNAREIHPVDIIDAVTDATSQWRALLATTATPAASRKAER